MNTIEQNLQTIAQALEIANSKGAFTLTDSATIAITLQNLTAQINELTPKKEAVKTPQAQVKKIIKKK